MAESDLGADVCAGGGVDAAGEEDGFDETGSRGGADEFAGGGDDVEGSVGRREGAAVGFLGVVVRAVHGADAGVAEEGGFFG